MGRDSATAKQEGIRSLLERARIVPAVRQHGDVARALAGHPPLIIVFTPSLEELPGLAAQVREAGSLLLVHADMMEGIASDAAGLRYLARWGVLGIATTRVHTMNLARQAGLLVTFRAFLIDSAALSTVAQIVEKNHPDVVELLPAPVLGHLPPGYVDALRVPVLAGGLVTSLDDVRATLAAGAAAISTSNETLWGQAKALMASGRE